MHAVRPIGQTRRVEFTELEEIVENPVKSPGANPPLEFF